MPLVKLNFLPPPLILCHISLYHSTHLPACPLAQTTSLESNVPLSPCPVKGLEHSGITALTALADLFVGPALKVC